MNKKNRVDKKSLRLNNALIAKHVEKMKQSIVKTDIEVNHNKEFEKKLKELQNEVARRKAFLKKLYTTFNQLINEYDENLNTTVIDNTELEINTTLMNRLSTEVNISDSRNKTFLESIEESDLIDSYILQENSQSDELPRKCLPARSKKPTNLKEKSLKSKLRRP